MASACCVFILFHVGIVVYVKLSTWASSPLVGLALPMFCLLTEILGIYLLGKAFTRVYVTPKKFFVILAKSALSKYEAEKKEDKANRHAGQDDDHDIDLPTDETKL